MGKTARIVAGTSIVLAPLTIGIGDQVRMVADPPASRGAGGYGVEQAAASLASINANRPAFLAASYLIYLAMLLSIPALLAIWRLSVDRAPRWAWTGAVLATLYALGQAVHLAGYNAMSLVFSAHHDLDSAAEILVAGDSEPFLIALFAPLYLIGLLGVIPQAIGLRRARIIPLWAPIAVTAGLVPFLVLGSTPLVSALSTTLIVVGLAPAALTMLGHQTQPTPATATRAAATA